jgi:Na+/H+ antiporter NhaD/arsenite permease-like protein
MVTEQQVVLAIFAVSFVLILAEYLHRTIAAWFGSVIMLLYGHWTGIFETHGDSLEHTMLGWIEFEVIGLLLGMMVFAAILELCGFFEFIAIKAAKMSGGDPWKLIVLLGTFTTLISLVIDNVTAIIIIAPVTLRICNRMEINPVPPLLAEAILSDTGGVASMVGDPPNVMIAAEAASRDMDNFGFNGFLFRLGILTLIAWIATLSYMRWYYRDWTETMPHNVESLLAEDEWDAVDDRKLMYTTLAILLLTVMMFSAKEFLHLEIEIHAIALAGAGLALVAAKPEDNELRGGLMHSVTEKIEWAALLFFAGLFILVGAVGNVGYLEALANWIFDNFGSDQVMLAVAIVWVSAIASAIVDNIPFTAAMIPVIVSIGVNNPEVEIEPLFWALAMGAGFGGNATPIGSSANVMTVAISERGPRPITTREWIRVGLPVMIITCIVATVFIVAFHGTLYSSL